MRCCNMPKKLSNPPLTLLTCPECLTGPQMRWTTCKTCGGKLWGYTAREKFFYWGRRVSGRILILEKMRHIWNVVIEMSLLIVVFLSWMFVGYTLYKDPALAFTDAQLYTQGSVLSLWFFIGFLVLLYIISRWWRARRVELAITYKAFGQEDDVASPGGPLTWDVACRFGTKKSVNVSLSYARDALDAVDVAYTIALKTGAAAVEPRHMFVALVQFSEVESILVRLGLWHEMIEEALGFEKGVVQAIKKQRGDLAHRTTASPAVQEILMQAYEEAYRARQEEVGLAELLVTTVRHDERLQGVLYDLGVEAQKVNNVIAWVRVHKTLRELRHRRHKAAMHRPRGQTNRAMTSIATPFLNQFSIDLTNEIMRGGIPPSIGREKELAEIFRIIEGGGKSVLLVGEAGVGKTALLYAIAELMLEDAVPAVMRDSRFVQVSVPALLSGATASEAGQRLLQIFNEVARSGNIVLCIEGIEDMSGVTSGGQQSLDVSEVLAQELQKGYFYTIATTEPEHFRRFVSHTAIANVMQTVNVPEMGTDETIRVLEAKVGAMEYRNGVWFSYAALEAAAKLTGRFMFDAFLPAPAIEVCQEAAHLARQTKGKNALVTDQDVATIVAGKTNIPVTAVTADEGQRLLKLEQEMHKRMIGQDEAVDHVANALRRARAELRSDKRPIATFLFLGPTGVGKTELAKTIAEVYFGHESNMVRLDMSEYQDTSAIQRMLGRPGEQGTGVLTEAIRQKPFALLLLDELEKASPDILNVFLQVFDDGRLTDSVGRTVDFTNVIIIATSNAGTAYIQKEVARGTSVDSIRERLLETELAQYYRPEFLNRFDGVIVFKPLLPEQIERIADLMLKSIVKKLDERGITLEFTPEVLRQLATEGYDPQFGARPMRRVIQDHVENKLASLLLENKLKRGAHIVYDVGDTVRVIEE